MRIVALSDTHGMNVNVPDGDVLVHAGDFSRFGFIEEVDETIEWLLSFPHKHKVIISGNHDSQMEKHSRLKDGFAFSGINYLEDSSIEIDGLVFYGSPWTPRFGAWSFMKDRGDEIAKVWEKIPDKVDVLITHGPPKGILDLTAGGYLAGCYDLLNKVLRINPQLHIFGHIHEGFGSHDDGVTKFYNVSIRDEYYQPTRKPTIIDL